MIENQTVKDRLKYFISSQGMGQGKFEAYCGLANGYVNNIRQSITPQKAQQIARYFPDLNLGWLLTGEGEMLKTSPACSAHHNIQSTITQASTIHNAPATTDKDIEIERLKAQLKEKDAFIDKLLYAMNNISKL